MTTVEIGYGKHPHSIPPELSPHNPAKLTMPAGVLGSEFAAPQADRLIADPYASGHKHLFDVSE
jgi:hypothetical protein